MNDALVQLVLEAVKEQYVNEKAFYSNELGISPQSWDRWKKGQQGLKYDNMQILSVLFTDYEWMLVRKVCRNAEIFPEVAADPVAEYKQLKFHTATKWIQRGVATVEWRNADKVQGIKKQHLTTLRISVNYGFWSYQDIIELHLPSLVRQQIESEKVTLLEWFDDYSKDALQDMNTVTE